MKSPQALRSTLANPAKRPPLTIKKPSPTSRRPLTRAGRGTYVAPVVFCGYCNNRGLHAERRWLRPPAWGALIDQGHVKTILRVNLNSHDVIWCCVVGTNFSVLISCNYQIARIFLMTLRSFFLPSDISHSVLHTRSLCRYCCAAIAKICFLNSRNHPNHSYFLDHTSVFLFRY